MIPGDVFIGLDTVDGRHRPILSPIQIVDRETPDPTSRVFKEPSATVSDLDESLFETLTRTCDHRVGEGDVVEVGDRKLTNRRRGGVVAHDTYIQQLPFCES